MINNYPVLDLHGEIRGSARILVDEFIKDNQKMGKYEVVIVHGIGEGILKKEVHNMLKKHRLVEEFHLDNFNSGCTLVKISKNIDKKGTSTYNNRHHSKGGEV